MTTPRALVALAAVTGLCACASLQPDAQYTHAALLSEAPPRSFTSGCRVSREPRALPAADALVDSAALLRDAVQAWRAGGRAPGHVLLALRYDPHGLNVRRDVIEQRVDGALADSVQKLAFAHRRRAEAADLEWSVRLRLDLGDAPRLRVGRTEICPPRMRNAAEAGWGTGPGGGWGDVRDVSAPPGQADLLGPSTIWVRVALDARGNVTEARVERSLVRVAQEHRLLSYVRSISFIPGMEDGYPVPGQLSIPLRAGR